MHPENCKNLILQLFGNTLGLTTWYCPTEASGTVSEGFVYLGLCRLGAQGTLLFSIPLQILLCQLVTITVAGCLAQSRRTAKHQGK